MIAGRCCFGMKMSAIPGNQCNFPSISPVVGISPCGPSLTLPPPPVPPQRDPEHREYLS